MKTTKIMGLFALTLIYAHGALAGIGESDSPNAGSRPTNGLPRNTSAIGSTNASHQPLALQFNKPIPLNIQSSAVEWKGQVFHLVQLLSARFELGEKTGQLKAEIKAGVTTFDDVTYQISVAVFDDAGTLLGAASTPCKVQREWLGITLNFSQTLHLDFGDSLDYPRAATFMVSISKQKVLTPGEWQRPPGSSNQPAQR